MPCDLPVLCFDSRSNTESSELPGMALQGTVLLCVCAGGCPGDICCFRRSVLSSRVTFGHLKHLDLAAVFVL